MSGWRRCDRCRRVLAVDDEFDGDASTCRACLTTPVAKVPAPKAAKAGPVSTRRTTPSAPPAPAGPRAPLLGTKGSGDLEVRERRARRTAHEALAEMYPEEFAQLLRDARGAEGLRT